MSVSVTQVTPKDGPHKATCTHLWRRVLAVHGQLPSKLSTANRPRGEPGVVVAWCRSPPPALRMRRWGVCCSVVDSDGRSLPSASPPPSSTPSAALRWWLGLNRRLRLRLGLGLSPCLCLLLLRIFRPPTGAISRATSSWITLRGACGSRERRCARIHGGVAGCVVVGDVGRERRGLDVLYSRGRKRIARRRWNCVACRTIKAKASESLVASSKPRGLA